MFSPAWLPDGKSVVVSVVSPPRQGAADLWRYAVDGGAAERIKQITTAPALLVSAPAMGVYGAAPLAMALIRFGRRWCRAFITAAAGRLRRLYEETCGRGGGNMTARTEVAFKPLPSPDGRLLVYATHYREQTALKV